MFKKNTAVTGFAIGHFINATTGAAVTTGTPGCKRILDGTGAACANAAAYNSDAGQWEIDLDAADTNGDMVGLAFTLTDCIPISYRFRTVTGIPDASGHYPADIIEAAGTAWASGAITADVLGADCITAAKIADDAIASEHLATGAITADAIAANAITDAKINMGAITAAKFAAGAIDATAIATDAIGADEISSAAVTKIQSGLATSANQTTILADTNEIQTDLTNGGRLDLLVDAIKAKTDTIPASPAAVGSAMTLTSAYDAAKTAAQASVCTETRLSELDAANLPTDVASVKSDTAAILTDTGTDGVVVAAASKTGYALSAAGVQAIWDALSSALNTVGSIGKRLVDYLTGDIFARIGAPAGASVSADIAAVKGQTADIEADTQDIQTQVGTDGAGLTAIGDTRMANLDAAVSSRLATAGYTAPPTTAQIKTAMEADGGKLDHLWEMTEDDAGVRRLTANALEQAPSGTGGDATAANQTTILNALTAIRGADNDTLKTLSDQIDGVVGGDSVTLVEESTVIQD